MKRQGLFFIAGILGALLLFFIGWEYNIPAAAWISYPLLIYSFRNIDRWYKTLPTIPLMVIARFTSIYGGWDIDLPMVIAFSALVILPLVISLFLDRVLVKRLGAFVSTLVFPCTYILLDYLLTYANLGMSFSLAYSQCTFLELIQSASLFGSWFVGFIVAWFAPMAVLLVSKSKTPSDRKSLVAYFVILAVLLTFGNLRLSFLTPQAKTVRIASIAEPHDIDYWSITDEGTPREKADGYKPQMERIQNNLFRSSQRAADFGAKIIFWSEGNCPVYEDDYPAFLEKAKSFAKGNNVYFMPAVVEFLYDRTKNNNLAIIINPDGEIEYRYEKTISWYPSDSDGIIPVIDTPYGRLSTAICFDMDYPAQILQARDADIMLVPSFDTKKIADFHSRVAFLRGLENGFSTVKQTNRGASISADYLGNTLAYQNYFSTDDRIMVSDVPMQGVRTLYGFTGEIFLWLVLAGVLFIVIRMATRRAKNGNNG